MNDLDRVMATLPRYELEAMGLINNNVISNEAEEFYISYSNSRFSVSDYGCDTTALYVNETGQFLILRGDHRDGYAGLNFNEAIEYFYNHIEDAHKYSDHGRIYIFDEEANSLNCVAGGYWSKEA